jgi:pseudouridylate synthase
VLRQRSALGAPGAVVVANPLDEQLDPALHARVLNEGLQAAAERGIAGRDVTPFLLERFHTHTGGESLRANVRLVLRNAALAAEIAAA